jgi:hypothetical protein
VCNAGAQVGSVVALWPQGARRGAQTLGHLVPDYNFWSLGFLFLTHLSLSASDYRLHQGRCLAVSTAFVLIRRTNDPHVHQSFKMEEIMEPKTVTQLVKESMEEIKDTERLAVVHSQQYLNEKVAAVTEWIAKLGQKRIAVQPLDRESLLWIYTLNNRRPFSSLDILMPQFLRIGERTPEKPLEIAFSVRGNLSPVDFETAASLVNRPEYESMRARGCASFLLWSLSCAAPEPGGFCTRASCVTEHNGVDPATMIENVALQLSSLETWEREMDAFIAESSLQDYFAPSILQARKKSVTDWLSIQLQKCNMLLSLEGATSRLLLEQLFTNTRTVGTQILLEAVSHRALNLLAGRSESPVKHRMTLHGQQYRHDDAFLLGQRRNNSAIFTNLLCFQDNVETARHSTPLIDVCYVRVNNQVVSMSLLDQSAYASIQIQLNSRRALQSRLTEDENEARMKIAHSEKALSEIATGLLTEYVSRISSNTIAVNELVVPFLSKRMHIIRDPFTGLSGSWAAIKDCLDRVLKMANSNVEMEANDSGAQSKQTLALETMLVGDFRHKNEANGRDEWSPAVAEMMQDKKNQLLLQHYQERKLKVNLLSVTTTDSQVLARTIIPCMTTARAIDSETGNIVVNDFNDAKPRATKVNRELVDFIEGLKKEDNGEVVMTKLRETTISDGALVRRKRQRKESEVKVLLARDVVDESAGENCVRLVAKRVEGPPDLASLQMCEACKQTKKLRAFYNSCKSYHYIRNVCRSCTKTK